MLKTKEKIYIYNRNRIIYTKDNKSYFKYNRKYISLNNDDDLYTNAKSIVYKYIGGFVGGVGGVGGEGEAQHDKLKIQPLGESTVDSEASDDKEENNKKCQDFYKVFSKVIINKIKNIIENKENYILYINNIKENADEEEEKEKKELNELNEQKDKIGEDRCKIIDGKIINIYFIDNLFKKYIVDIIYDDDDDNSKIVDYIYSTENENVNEKSNCLKYISNSIKNKKKLFGNFKDFWTKKKEENCDKSIDIKNNEEDDYYKEEPFTKIKSNLETEIIIEYDKIKLKEYLQSIVDYNLNKEIIEYYNLYKNIMKILP